MHASSSASARFRWPSSRPVASRSSCRVRSIGPEPSRLRPFAASTRSSSPSVALRRVEVTRGKSTVEIDLLRFEMRGDLSQNPFVEEGMAVHVPPRGPFITLAGAVRRPGDYEIGPRASLRDLLDVTGGLSQSAAPTE